MIKIGDTLPEATFTISGENGPETKTTADIFAHKKVVIFGVPGAFTPTCHGNHLPGFVTHADAFKAKGIDTIACVSVNDVFVMKAWAEASHVDGKILFLADGSATFTKAIGMALDLNERGLGIRSQRYSLLVDNGVVRRVNLEETVAKADVSGAEAILGQL